MRFKPACMHCKGEINENDEVWEMIEDDIDHKGEIEVVGVTEGKTLHEIIEGEELCCNTCNIEIPKLTFDNGWCFFCYDKGSQVGTKVKGTVRVEPNGNFSEILACDECYEFEVKPFL